MAMAAEGTMKLAEIFSDGEQGSWGRFGSTVCMFVALIWISILVSRISQLADLPHLAEFIKSCAYLIGIPYGLSKAGDTIAEFKRGGGQ